MQIIAACAKHFFYGKGHAIHNGPKSGHRSLEVSLSYLTWQSAGISDQTQASGPLIVVQTNGPEIPPLDINARELPAKMSPYK